MKTSDIIQPLVSIGIPTYNRPNSLRKTLESVSLQTYQNLEIIVSDNCSPGEQTVLTVNEFLAKDNRIKFFRQEKNIGMEGNFPFVLKQATGEYFMWLADDDWLDLNFIEECTKFILKNPDYSLVSGRTKFYDENNNYLRDGEFFQIPFESPRKRVTCYYKNVYSNSFYYGITKRKYLLAVGVITGLVADLLQISRLCLLGKLKMLDNTYSYRCSKGVSENAEKLFEFLNINKKLAKFASLLSWKVIFRDILRLPKDKLNILKKYLIIINIVIFRFIPKLFPFTKVFSFSKKKTMFLMSKLKNFIIKN